MHKNDDGIYRQLVNNIIDYAIYLLNPDGYVMSWNTGARLIKGYEPEDIIGQHFSIFYTAEDRENNLPQENLRHARCHGRFDAEGWRLRHDGQRLWVNVVIDAVYDDDGAFIGFAKVTRDITEVRQQQIARLEEGERFRLMVDGVRDHALYMMSPDGIVTNWNAGAQRLKGYTQHEAVGQHFSMFYGAEDRQDHLPAFELERARTIGRHEAEGWRYRKDGSAFWANVVINAIRDDHHQLIGFAKISRDITERRAWEKALEAARESAEQRNRELDELSAFLQAVIGNIPLHVLVQDLSSGDMVLDSIQGRALEKGYLPEVSELLARLAPLAERTAETGSAEDILLSHSGPQGMRQLRCSTLPVQQSQGDYLLYLIEDVTEAHRNQASIRFMAHHDALTRLPNRARFHQRLEQAIEQGNEHTCSTGLLMIDLDNFKDINDVLGHHVGDRALAEISVRLGRVLKTQETLARLGGDEFALIVPGCKEDSQLIARAMALQSACRQHLVIDHHQVHIGLSIGIAMTSELIDSSNELMKAADMAMYEVKHGDKGGWAYFTPELEHATRQRLNMESDLHQVLERNELVLYYQPVISAGNHMTSSREALLRWRHPKRGMVSPMEFIPVAERTGAIHAIGEWVLQEACRTAMNWPDDVSVAVNLSPVQFERSTLVAQVQKALALSGLPPARLELEITESILLDTSQRNIHTLRALKALGVSIALDDFGTGYSSLHYLRSFPFDRIKIDRSFISEICNDQQALVIVKAITSLGSSLGIKVTAEGVEHLEQADVLEREGCSHLQGFFFGHPTERT